MSILASEEILVAKEGQKLKTAVFVHGLLGSGRNWRSFAKLLDQMVADRTGNSSSGAGGRFSTITLKKVSTCLILTQTYTPCRLEASLCGLETPWRIGKTGRL